MFDNIHKFRVVLKSYDNNQFEFITLAENEETANKLALAHILKEFFGDYNYKVIYTEKIR